MNAGSTRTAMPSAVTVGAIGGLAWAGALRAYMSEINGAASTVEWAGTFLGILVPALLVGGCLGAAAAMPASPARPGILRWLAASPLLLAVAPLLLPGALMRLLTQGLGGGAIGVALGGIAGGFAIGGRRPAARIASGVIALAIVVATASSVPLIGGDDLGITTARGAWMLILVASLMVVLCIACSIPFRRLTALRNPASASITASVGAREA